MSVTQTGPDQNVKWIKMLAGGNCKWVKRDMIAKYLCHYGRIQLSLWVALWIAGPWVGELQF